jgi:hypothetical protein
MLAVHYAPRTPLTLIVGVSARERLSEAVRTAVERGKRVGVLALAEDLSELPSAAKLEVVGTWSDPSATAVRLFEAMRSLDAARLDTLYARELADPTSGLGRALADRLRRASRHVLDSRD